MKKTIRFSGLSGLLGIILLAGHAHADKAPALPNPPPVFKAQDVGRTNPFFPALRSGLRLLQRPSPQQQIPSNNPCSRA